jgi:hypothetical protein
MARGWLRISEKSAFGVLIYQLARIPGAPFASEFAPLFAIPRRHMENALARSRGISATHRNHLFARY